MVAQKHNSHIAFVQLIQLQMSDTTVFIDD